MSKWRVIVNPVPGRFRAPVLGIRDALDRFGIDGEVVVPESQDEAEAALRAAAMDGVTHIAVAGGDGSVSLAANVLLGIEGLERPVLGVIPTGTGCDLLRTFGIPQDLDGAVKHLATEDVYDIDVALVKGAWGSRYYVNVAQVGVGAAAAHTAAKLARVLGSSRYPIAYGARLPRFPKAVVTVETERRTYESEALAVVMANGQFFAGGWNIAPKATLVDGVVDVQVISCHKRQAPALLPKVIRGTHLGDGSVKRFTAATFTIETDIPWPVEADGYHLGNTPVSGRVVGAALRLKI